MLDTLFGSNTKKSKEIDAKKAQELEEQKKTEQANKNLTLRDQVRKILETPDDQYSDKLLTSEMRKYITDVEDEYSKNISDFKSHIAPSYREAKITDINISGLLGKSYYTQSYPTYIDALRTRDILSIHAKRDMAFYIYPEDDSAIQGMLKRKATQLKAELSEAMQKGITIDKDVEQQYRDVEMIREKLSTREERYFEFSSYFNIYDTTEDKLKEEGKKFEQKI
ncbi:MAG: hypothetical protein LBO09_00270 [Candidatus Peribacteria bacterium]|jgi:hypothetical protein|nr:hypothetical protein [Candidatus Peribacteria bacterium]